MSAKLASLPEHHDVPDEVVARSLSSCSLSLSAWPIAGMAAGSDDTPWPRRSVPAHVEADSSEPEATAAREPLQPIAPTSICLPLPVRLEEAEPCAVQRLAHARPRFRMLVKISHVGTKILEVSKVTHLTAVMSSCLY
ncbi:MAG: hypothetical protein ACPIOQ_35125, partial [Promethearchaeia archaeon]